MPVPSCQSWGAIILGLFFFFSAEIRPKNGNKNPTIHLSTRLLGFKSKRWSLGFLRIVQPKIQKSKNPSFQTESLDSGQKDGFLDFPRFFLDFFGFFERVFGFLGFQIKNPKKLKEKDGFLQKSKKNLGKRWIFPILISKIQKNFRKKMDFSKKSKNMQVKVGFLQKSIFFLEFFWIFDLETQKSKHPFEESKKIQKNLGKSKNPSFWPESKDSVWKDGFLDFWIFWQPARPRMSSALGHKMDFCLEYIAENFAHSGFARDYFQS